MFCAQSRPKRRLHATKNSVEFLNHSPLLTLVSNSGSDPNYSCFEKGCLTNGEKLTRRYRKLLWVMVVYVCLSEPRGVSAWWKETAQTRIRFLFVVESAWTSIKQSQTLTTHNASRHCRVSFYTFAGQPLSKQLYTLSLQARAPRLLKKNKLNLDGIKYFSSFENKGILHEN